MGRMRYINIKVEDLIKAINTVILKNLIKETFIKFLEEKNMTNKVSEFKGNKVLILDCDNQYPFSFGVEKAKLIINNIEEIKNFIKEYEKTKK